MTRLHLYISRSGVYDWKEILLYKVIRMDFPRQGDNREYIIGSPFLSITPFWKVITIYIQSKDSKMRLIENMGLEYVKNFAKHVSKQLFEANKTSLLNEYSKASDNCYQKSIWQTKTKDTYTHQELIEPSVLYNELKNYAFKEFLQDAMITLAFAKVEVYNKSSDSFSSDGCRV